MSNIYYSPEAYGLETVGEVEFSSGSYEFDTTVVWRDKETGSLYYADDSGCSCPSPFESENRATITKIGRTQDLIDHLEQRKRNCYRYTDEDYYSSAKSEIDAQCGELILKVRAL